MKIQKIKLRSAVELNDSEMKAVRGRYSGNLGLGCSWYFDEWWYEYRCSGSCTTMSEGEYVSGTCSPTAGNAGPYHDKGNTCACWADLPGIGYDYGNPPYP